MHPTGFEPATFHRKTDYESAQARTAFAGKDLRQDNVCLWKPKPEQRSLVKICARIAFAGGDPSQNSVR